MNVGHTARYTFSLLLIITFLVINPVLANESVGKLIFTIGKVHVIDIDGKQKIARRGAEIFQGDTIKTFLKGQAQIKFIDGARVSVRAGSEFKIDAYVYTENTDSDKSEMNLIRGGIRAVTGAIGKRNKKSYKMKTAVATIGIRGTDYSLMFCQSGCKGEANENVKGGLYVGVVNGGVTVTNDFGSVSLDENQYATVGSISMKPQMLIKPPSFLMFDKSTASKKERTAFNNSSKKDSKKDKKTENTGSSSTAENKQGSSRNNSLATSLKDRVSDDVTSEPVKATTPADNLFDRDRVAFPEIDKTDTIEKNITPTPLRVNRLARFFTSSLARDRSLHEYVLQNSDTDRVTSFYQADSSASSLNRYNSFAFDTSQIEDYGYDSETGLSWGRWSRGNIRKTLHTTDNSATESLDYNQQSLHWVQGLNDSDNIQLPITGSRNFTLVGNTRPTDNLGNVGTLGSASLIANFDTQMVDADVALSINQQLWRAEQQNIPLTLSTGKFFGDQLNVQVIDATGLTDGTGGQITGGLTTSPSNGGAFGYLLEANINEQATTVSGVAVFQETKP